MALSATIINSEDVRVVLGASSNKWSDLCPHPNVNKWSKWKPIRSSKEEGITLSDLQTANWGISAPSYTSLTSLFAAYHAIPAGEADWIYLKPRGGASEPYRIGDFRSYDHSAPATVGDTTIKSKIFLQGSPSAKTASGSMMTAQPDPYYISYDDLTWSYKYLGLAFFNTSNSLVYYYINPASGARYVEFDANLAGIQEDTYRAILFLSSSPSSASNIIGIHGVGNAYNLVDVANIAVSVGIVADWIGDDQLRTVRVVMTYRNNTSGTITLTNSELRLRYSDKTYNDILESGESRNQIGTISVPPTPAGGLPMTQTYDFTFVDSAQYWVVWWFNDGLYPNLYKANIRILDI